MKRASNARKPKRAVKVLGGLRRQPPRASLIDFIDPAVESGQWSWTLSGGRLRFVDRRRRG